MRPRGLKFVFRGVAAVGVLLLVAAAALYAVSERMLQRQYPIDPDALELSMQDASLDRGEHLVRAVASCTLCHGDDLGGKVYADMGPLGMIAGVNLTRGDGGMGAHLTRADYVRAIRYCVRADGTSLVAMPSEVFTHFSDADLASIIAYVEQVPPVDRELPRTHFGLLGRALLALGRLNILVAPKTHHSPATGQASAESAIARGRYLADVSGCHGCHGFGLSGGPVAGPPGLPPAANLTPAGLGTWRFSDFVRVMRTGERPDHRILHEFMPWRIFSAMTDRELADLWAYLRSVPPKASGNK